MANTEWVAYERTYHRGNGRNVIVKLATERAPFGHGWHQRIATDAEIEAETKTRAEALREAQEQDAFQARPEYAQAQRVRDRLEFMSRHSHPLDALTVDEWYALAEKLTKGGD